jgi:hypothetical protein
MYTPAADDEVTGLTRYLDQQLDALRAAAVGLTEEQVRMRPCRSALSIGGLLKHAVFVMRGATDRLTEPVHHSAHYDADALAAYESSFALSGAETAAGVLAEFDAARVAYLSAVAATDPAAATVEPPSPWFGIFDARPANARYQLVHQIEEMARHAGHADIIREQIDGVSVPAIMLSQAGMPANQFFEPYVAAPGTVGGPPAC